MTSGTVLLDRDFRFEDDSTKEKFVILLNDGSDGRYLAVKTTSQDRMYTYREGCQMDGRFPCFYLRQGRCCLPKDTWVQLDYFYEFDATELAQRVLVERVVHLGVLPYALRTELVKCALESPDIIGTHAAAIARFAG